MSVKLAEKAAPSMRHESKELAHRVGDSLTGGKSQIGYLAVCELSRPHLWGEANIAVSQMES